MKLQLKTQALQTEAVAAVVDLFRDREKRQDTFNVRFLLKEKSIAIKML